MSLCPLALTCSLQQRQLAQHQADLRRSRRQCRASGTTAPTSPHPAATITDPNPCTQFRARSGTPPTLCPPFPCDSGSGRAAPLQSLLSAWTAGRPRVHLRWIPGPRDGSPPPRSSSGARDSLPQCLQHRQGPRGSPRTAGGGTVTRRLTLKAVPAVTACRTPSGNASGILELASGDQTWSCGEALQARASCVLAQWRQISSARFRPRLTPTGSRGPFIIDRNPAKGDFRI